MNSGEAAVFSRSSIEQLSKRYRTNFINSLTGFKSVALIGTQDQAGKTNVAVFSQIFHVGAHPPLVGVLFRPDTVARHTLENILQLQQFTINHISDAFVERAHHSSARWDISEFEACHLTPEYTPLLQAPYVREASVKLGLQLAERQDIQINGTILLIGEILEVILPRHVVGEDGFVDLEAAGTVTCSGLDAYHTTRKIARYSYAKPYEEIQKI